MRSLLLALALSLAACDGAGPDPGKSDPDIDADGYAADVDCDDYDASVHPDAEERCNAADDDCDSEVDEGALRTFYADADADGFGDAATTSDACDLPAGFVEDATDCDDADDAVNPDAVEICDGADDDCDGTTDEDAIDAPVWYADGDADGFGDPDDAVVACDAPVGFVDVTGDCDDGDDTRSPAGVEVCGGGDEDCDGETDEADAGDAPTWYADADGDGYGDDAVVTTACAQPDGYTDVAGDCDDADVYSHPGGTELCGGGDEDCDGEVDEAGAAERTWFYDGDGDGYGLDSDTVFSCEGPAGYAVFGGDCDDGDAAVSPAATEVCGGGDEDCDGTVDEADAADATAWYLDGDDDGYGSTTSTTACDAPSGYVGNADDCDDADATAHPGGTEVCGGGDEDCDGTVDEADAADRTWYRDADGDGYGSTTSTSACDAPSGYVDNAEDCDDGDAASSPAGTETCGDGLDQDCDGTADDGCALEHCGTISIDETWDASIDHDVTCDVTVASGATLTISSGANVAFAAGTGLTVDGALDATGAVLTSGAASPAAGDWDGVTVAGSASLTDVDVSYGGDCLVVTGRATLSDTYVSGCSGTALVATAGTLTAPVTGAYAGAGGSASVSPANVAALDASASVADGVEVAAGTVSTSATWVALDAPYTVAGDVRVEGASSPVLTLGEGVELDFASGAGLVVGEADAGGLVAVGTSSSPIVLTSAQAAPAAGDWDGVTVGDLCVDASVAFTYAEVSYGGGNGTGDLAFTGCDGTVTDSTISDSAAWGVYADTSTLTMSGNAFFRNASGNVGP